MEEKKKSDSEFLSYNLMLHCGKKIQNIYSNSRVVRKKYFWTKQKTIPPPLLQVKWSVSKWSDYDILNNFYILSVKHQNQLKRLLSFISEYFKACDILDFSYVHKSSVYNINEQRIFIIRGNR